ncbi:AraC family transcriptional regulator [Acinetobacter johnsonii]|uniref:helix-turn-helix transcriptional regulator n=1 Tax=Acinetobacter johnsonii TaxID=40214 RepID=UPI003D186A13
MDALSKIFEDIHLNQSEYLYLKPYGEWAFRYSEQSTMMAYAVLQGQFTICLDAKQIIVAEVGDLILLPSGPSHECRSSTTDQLLEVFDISDLFAQNQHKEVSFGSDATQQETVILALHAHMDPIMARPLVQALPAFIHLQHQDLSTVPEWLQIGLQFLALEVQRIRPGRDKILDHLVSILLIECVRDYIDTLQDSNNWLSALSHPELSNALAKIHAEPAQPWTVESLAEQCCMSRSKFATLFSQILGTSPLAYLQQHRLRLAAQYLRNKQGTIQQIAHRVGYNSETAFSQSFKRQYQMSPSQYRNHPHPSYNARP